MSAIAGLIRFDNQPVEAATLERMRDVLAPYGRDAQHCWRHGTAGFVHTLLRTTPQDSLESQPLHDAASKTVLVFDGRLDNRDDLARELGLRPAETALMADSTLALQACLRWDTGALPRLLGDFALACWQPARRRLWLARDPMGRRPLFWHRQAGFLAFATLPKALFAVPDVPRALCEQALHDYLCLLPAKGPQSMFQDVFRVEPGQVLVQEDQRSTTQRFHAFDAQRELRLPRDEDYVEAFREQLDRAVQCRLRACGPIASHLSSGFDSATVTAVAAGLLAPQGRRLRAYTAVPREGFDGPVPRGRHADEGPGARALAARFANIDHVLVRSDGTSALEHLAADVETLDRAPLNPGNMAWTHAIQDDAARHGAKVLLSGQRGNASISYTGEPYLAALFGCGQWSAWLREARALRRRRKQRWRGLLAASLAPWLPPTLWEQLQRWRGRRLGLHDYSAIHPEFAARMHSAQRARELGWDLSYRPHAHGRAMRIAMLTRLDAAEHGLQANLAGLDMRDPTGDLRLIEFCLSVPEDQYLRDGRTRWLLRRAMADVLPPEIMQARTKGLQAADGHEATTAALPRIREELARLGAHSSAGRYLDLDALAQTLQSWPREGHWDPDGADEIHHIRLLRGLSVGTFIRHVEQDNA